MKLSTKVSVIIATYNRRTVLQKVLPAIIGQDIDRSLFEVLLIDDGSTDNTEFLAKEFTNEPNFSYFKIEKNGAAKARNEGIERAKGEIIVFIDSDIIVKNDFVEEHIRSHEKEDNLIIRGSVIAIYDIERPFIVEPKITDISNAFFATGNTSVKKKYLVNAGLFDEGFSQYGWEDLELGLRLKKLGLKVVDNPKALGYHYQKKFALEDFHSREIREENRAKGAVTFVKKWPLQEVRLMTQDILIFFLLQKFFFALQNIFPHPKKVISFLIKYKKTFWLGIYVNFYFNMVYLKYFEKERSAQKNE